MIGIGINIAADFLRITSQQGEGGEEPPAFDIDVQAWLDLITDKPSTTQNDYVNIMIKDMKSGLGVERMMNWADTFYHLAAETAEASLKNMVKDAHHAVAVNGPVHTPFEGWGGDGISSYIDTNYNPATHGVNYKQDDASLGAYSRSDEDRVDVDIGLLEGNYGTFLRLRNGNKCLMRINNASTCRVEDTMSDSFGLYIGTRYYYSCISLVGYKNKSVLSNSEGIATTNGIPNCNATLLALNNQGTRVNFSKRQLSLAFIAKYISESMRDAIYDPFQALMTKNGKQV